MTTHSTATARTRLLVAIISGILIGILCIIFGASKFAALAAWDAVILVYGCWVWLTVFPMSPQETKSHAVWENPGRTTADGLLLIASVVSLVAVIMLITQAHRSSGATKAAEIALSLVSVVLSWAIVHTTYMLKYARLYYGQAEGGISFNEQASPDYKDFAYLAFTLGMTFQVSDTNLQTKEIRATALKQSLLSYIFGTIIIATTINTLASLSQ